jgi:hypothetical protein
MAAPPTRRCHTADRVEELLHDNVCPVCLCKKNGKNPRHQLIMHFRRAADAEHKLFRTKEYTKHFKVGRSKNPVTHECTYKTIEKMFGRDVAQKYINCIEFPRSRIHLVQVLY